MKKILALFLAMLFTVTAFGVSTLFGSVAVGAEESDPFEYTPFPGFAAFTAEDYEALQNPYVDFKGFSDDGKMTDFAVKSYDKWGVVHILSCAQNDLDSEYFEYASPWAPKTLLGETDIFGGADLSFENADGVKFTVNKNGEPYGGQVTLYCYQVPTKGPYYAGGELQDLPVGFVYFSRVSSENGEFYFDFEKDFKQEDWWSTDDDGVNQFAQEGVTSVPNKTLPLINGFDIRLYANEGETISIGNFAICTYKIPRTEKLDEQIMRFESLDKSRYTKESYALAYEAYLRAVDYHAPSLTKPEVFAMTQELKNAINALDPLFLIEDKSTDIVGFEVWDDSDLKTITDAGFDTAEWFLDFDEPVIAVGAGSVNNGPNFGYSRFSSAVTVDGETVAVKNPFEAVSPDKPLSKAAGIRFHLKWGEGLIDGTIGELRVAVGSSADDKVFEAVIPYKELPENEGDIAVSWGEFEQVGGTGRISPYIDSLDYIGIYVENAVGVYYVSDLSAARFSYSQACLDELKRTISEAFALFYGESNNPYNGIHTNPGHSSYWFDILEMADEQREIALKYAVTEDEIDAAIRRIERKIDSRPIGGYVEPDYITRFNSLATIAEAIAEDSVTPDSFENLQTAIAKGKDLGPDDIRHKYEDEYNEAYIELEEALKKLIRIDGEVWDIPSVINVSDGDTVDVTDMPFVPVWDKGTAILDSRILKEGDEIYSNGEHTLTVYNGGAITRVNFTVIGENSAPVFEGIDHGGTYTGITLSWDKGVGRLNKWGEDKYINVENGLRVEESGSYVLYVTHRDKSSAVAFWIEGARSKLLGDLDGDELITVSDALCALRVAARLGEESERVLKYGDMDSDGNITVADALNILRLAANL